MHAEATSQEVYQFFMILRDRDSFSFNGWQIIASDIDKIDCIAACWNELSC